MKIVQINAVCESGSTGKICIEISKLLTERGIENYILHTEKKSNYEYGICCADNKYIKLQALKTRIFGNYGFNSRLATRKLIHHLTKINPDAVCLHNIHGHNVNLTLLFKYLKDKNIKVFWTFHDCWAFTAYCAHFEMAKCNKWQSKCCSCPEYKKMSWFFDRSTKMYNRKKKLFTSLNDLTIITPSEWLAGLVRQSFLSKYPVKVINNGINLSIFKPTESDFRKKHSIEDKFIILGVAFGWGKRKGFDVFIELSKRLNSDFQIVMVGTNEQFDKMLPKNIISVHKTKDQKELAEIYTAADLFVNPTREENYPTVNMESLACGTPVLTFKTGGSPEIVDNTCGSVVERNDIESLYNEIIRIKNERPYTQEACLKKATEFDAKSRFSDYVRLYKGVE